MNRRFYSDIAVAIILVFAASGWRALPAQTTGAQRHAIVIREVGHMRIPPLGRSGALTSNLKNASPDLLRGNSTGSAPSTQDAALPDVYVQNFQGATLPVTVKLNFEGMNSGGPNEPFPAPDPNGAVGGTQYVEWVNADFAVYNKQTGALLYGPAAAESLFKSMAGPCATQNSG